MKNIVIDGTQHINLVTITDGDIEFHVDSYDENEFKLTTNPTIKPYSGPMDKMGYCCKITTNKGSAYIIKLIYVDKFINICSVLDYLESNLIDYYDFSVDIGNSSIYDFDTLEEKEHYVKLTQFRMHTTPRTNIFGFVHEKLEIINVMAGMGILADVEVNVMVIGDMDTLTLSFTINGKENRMRLFSNEYGKWSGLLDKYGDDNAKDFAKSMIA